MEEVRSYDNVVPISQATGCYDPEVGNVILNRVMSSKLRAKLIRILRCGVINTSTKLDT